MLTKPPPLDWTNILLLVFVHAVAVVGMAIYVPVHGLPLPIVVITAILTVVTIFSISAGYHRLFSHRAYEAHPALRFFLLAFGAGSFQNSALVWASDHRRHHARVDSDEDPYDARRGFWHAHMGWVMRRTADGIRPIPVRDLDRDRLVMLQHRFYVPVSIAMGVGLPVLLGLAFGDPWGGFIVAGAVRLLVVYHATFAINSFAHFFGKQPYSDDNSSRDSLLTALVSMGEGYHNFHHTFPSDYRNGVHAHQFDPTKWILATLSGCRAVRGLRRAPQSAIVRAQLRMDERRLAAAKLQPDVRERLQQLRTSVDQAATRWHELVARYEAAKREATDQARAMLASLRAEIRAATRELRAAHAHWRQALRSPLVARS